VKRKMADARGDDTTEMAPPLSLKSLERLSGRWEIEITHPHIEGKVRGSASFEWLWANRFLLLRSNIEHPDFPDSISLIGIEEGAENFTMHYFDSRGVARTMSMSLADGVWRIWREGSDFSQRYTGRFEDHGTAITGRWEINEDGTTYKHDFGLTYRKVR
jgi:hypothetical protein